MSQINSVSNLSSRFSPPSVSRLSGVLAGAESSIPFFLIFTEHMADSLELQIGTTAKFVMCLIYSKSLFSNWKLSPSSSASFCCAHQHLNTFCKRTEQSCSICRCRGVCLNHPIVRSFIPKHQLHGTTCHRIPPNLFSLQASWSWDVSYNRYLVNCLVGIFLLHAT